MNIRLAVGALALVAVGCGSIQERVDPVAKVAEKRICVQINSQARDTFLVSYQTALERKGFTVVIVPELETPKGCPLISTYKAAWQWSGLTVSMTYADILVHKDGQLAGRAMYNATSSRTLEKMINADSKIAELVDKLFPNP